jgi:hypothetical protein
MAGLSDTSDLVVQTIATIGQTRADSECVGWLMLEE